MWLIEGSIEIHAFMPLVKKERGLDCGFAASGLGKGLDQLLFGGDLSR